MTHRLNPNLSRRAILKGAAGATAATTLGMPFVARAQSSQIVVATSGGQLEAAYEAAYYGPFTEATGVEIIKAPTDYAKLKAMVDAGAPEWDVAQMAADQVAIFSKQGLLEPLDPSGIDTDALLPGTLYPDYVLSDLAAAVMSWNTQLVSEENVPQTWADVFDLEKVPGGRGFWRQASEILELALLADGVAPADLYPMDVDRAFKVLDTIKSEIVWWTAGAQSVQLLTSGEVPIAMSWNGRLYGPQQDGAPIDFHLKQALFVADSWLMPKGLNNKAAANEFIAFTLQPERQAEFAKHIPYGPVNRKAFDLISPERMALLPSAPENFAQGVIQNGPWWAEHGVAANERFNEWLLT